MSDGSVRDLHASVVIVTHDRKNLLRAALASATSQSGTPEVIVMDDGSTDGTAEMVEAEFPHVRLVRSAGRRGYIVLRNKAAELATTNIIVSLDDDARFSSADTVALTAAEFSDPRIGAVAMPLIHITRGPEVLQHAPSGEGIWITNSYIGTAHALRRDVFLALGGYREDLEHFLEEPDFCIRLMVAGYAVRLGRAEPILHEESVMRNMNRGVRYLWRNHLLFTWFHVPFPYNVPRSLVVAVSALWFGIRMREPMDAVQGLLRGIRYIAEHRQERAPVPVADYRRWRLLRRHPARLHSDSSISSR